MPDATRLHFEVPGDDFTRAGEASQATKQALKKMGFPSEAVRKVAIAMYEGEINMVIHATGGTVDVTITPQQITMVLSDQGPGIPDIDLAMQEGYSTATENERELDFGAGMGLPNMLKYTDHLDIQTEVGIGTTVTMTVHV